MEVHYIYDTTPTSSEPVSCRAETRTVVYIAVDRDPIPIPEPEQPEYANESDEIDRQMIRESRLLFQAFRLQRGLLYTRIRPAQKPSSYG